MVMNRRAVTGLILTAALALPFAGPGQAQQFTSAAEVKPILEATKGNWVSVREYEGQDLLYFTHLLAWRCGLDAIYYSINGGSESRYQAEPCHEGEAQPNAIRADAVLPFLRFELGSIKTVDIRLVYDDGSEGRAHFERNAIMTP